MSDLNKSCIVEHSLCVLYDVSSMIMCHGLAFPSKGHGGVGVGVGKLDVGEPSMNKYQQLKVSPTDRAIQLLLSPLTP